jgi:hypothetical protein
MSKRGVDFLNDWIVEHINPDAYPRPEGSAVCPGLPSRRRQEWNFP